MGMKHYILQGKITVPVGMMKWARWFQDADRHVAKDEFDGVEVSTVFLGLDHNWLGGAPLLFETMVFTDIEGGGDMWRYSTWEQAEAGHQAAVALMRRKLVESKSNSTKALDKIMTEKVDRD